MDFNFVIFIVVMIFLNFINVNCDYGRQCYEKCLANSVHRNSHNNIDIYLEYKKAVIKVPAPPKIEPNRFITLPNGEIIPGMLTYHPQRPKFFWKRHLRGINTKANEVTMRDFVVTPVEERCSAKSLSKTRDKIKCKPRPFVLDVISPGGKVVPDKILARQCSGYCNGNRICSAVSSKNVSSSVQIVMEDGTTQCSTILVPQDTKCKCQCATTEKDCNANQKFNKKLCSCECTNKVEESHCNRKIELYKYSHFWDPKACSCACLRDSPCTTGTFWDKTRCRCSKNSDNG